jgi:hypothetical protein
VLDFNRILLLLACLSPAVVLVRTWKRAALNRAWRRAAWTVLFVTALAWLFAPKMAGFVGGGAWLALLLLPAAGVRRAMDLASHERYASGRRIIGWLRFLHPARALRDEHTLLRALELADEANETPRSACSMDSRNATAAPVYRQTRSNSGSAATGRVCSRSADRISRSSRSVAIPRCCRFTSGRSANSARWTSS